MEVPEIQPGEDVYKYISRVRKELGTDYVYVLCGTEVLAPTNGSVNIETAKTVLDYARMFTKGMPAGLNAVVATLDDFEGNMIIKKIGDDAYLIAFVNPNDSENKKEKTMKIEEITP
ncbi:MAG TPA: hypothetical protein EYH23_01405 [Euryarchaeota archaeon]|nr:hypothetical protein [Euryarchaeota archaeon]HIQ10152.1 hypothetical protein [Euryarchaeota archaeon]